MFVACLCPDCENVELMCEGIGKACDEIDLPSKCHDLINKIACDPITECCAAGNCEKCPELDLEPIKDCDTITFYVWCKGEKYYEKKLIEKSGVAVADKLTACLKDIKMHYFRKRTQSNEYKKQINELKEGQAVIHVDYSENYKNKQQNEIKAAYYGQGQFSLFTVCIYMKENENITCKSYALVTLENDHSCNVSFALNNFLICKIKEDTTISSIKFWSDGCASQFRSQFAFYMMTKFDRNVALQWHYFEANHGKGAVDGIGGTVKHAVYRHVLSKKVVIRSPQHFAEYADSILPKISVIFVDNENLQLSFHEECRANAVYIYGALKVHFVDRIISEMKCDLKFYMTSLSSHPINEIEYDCPGGVPAVGDYYLVMYEGGLWPGQVIQVKKNGQIIQVKCLEKAEAPTGSYWKWPAKKDEHEYPLCDIKQKINTPQLLPGGRRGITFLVPELAHIWG